MCKLVTAEPEYDSQGRMLYHPDYHERQGKRFTEEELEYMCKYWKADGCKTIAFAIGRTQSTLASRMVALKKQGLYEYYRNLNKHW